MLQKWLLVGGYVERMTWKGVVRQVVWVAVAGAGMTAMEGIHWALNENTKLLDIEHKD